MKNIVKLSVVALALCGITSAMAAAPGGYLGLGLGYNTLGYSKGYTLPNYTVTQTNGGLGGRVFGGYNFNEYLGLEAGYEYYAKSKLTQTDKVTKASGSATDQLQTLDLVGKVYLPVSDSGINVYALGGAAYVRDHISGTDQLSANVNKVRPKFGAGVSYDIPDTAITTSLEATRVQGTGTLANADSVLLNISYNFG